MPDAQDANESCPLNGEATDFVVRIFSSGPIVTFLWHNVVATEQQNPEKTYHFFRASIQATKFLLRIKGLIAYTFDVSDQELEEDQRTKDRLLIITYHCGNIIGCDYWDYNCHDICTILF
uniref:Uncharacterized protein n=1 Tax=Romanomermis culicivorax TaxID=13658 RepID=A0A915JKM5_ROMCU